MKTHRVSVVASTFNEARNIGHLLKSCLNQTYSNLEVIVVDSQRTSDNTAEIARESGAKVYKYGRERSEQRNFGVKKATGKYVLILDADMKLESEVIGECAKVIGQDSETKSVIIPEKSYGENYWARCKALERNCYLGDPRIEAARFFDRSLFLNLGGYDSKMISGEDWDLARKFKNTGKVGRINKFIYHNEGRLSLLGDVRKKIYYSRKSDQYIFKNVKSLKDIILFVFRPAYFRNWKVLLSDPVHLPGMVLMKLFELLFGGIVILTKPAIWSATLTGKKSHDQ